MGFRVDAVSVNRYEEQPQNIETQQPETTTRTAERNDEKIQELQTFGAGWRNILETRLSQEAASVGPPQPFTQAEAQREAEDIINRHGGHSHPDAEAIGRELAEVARQNPANAALVGQQILDQISATDKEDNVSQAFVETLSVEELREVGQSAGGEEFLERVREHMLSGSVHSPEVEAAGKVDRALTGFDTQSLQGNPEDDARAIDEQLKSLPPEMRDEFLSAVLAHPFGREALRYAATMSAESQHALGEAFGELYRQNPAETSRQLQEIADSPEAMPYYYQSGLAGVVAQSGNDDLIRSFAEHEIDKAESDPEQVRGYLNAVTALSGLSPQALQDVMRNNADFFAAVEEAGRLTEGPGNESGFPNYNILERGLGDLLRKASQIEDASGQSTPEALKLFATAVKYTGDNFSTREGAGAFFIEHAEQVVDTYADPRNGGPDKANSFNPEVLQTFFAGVVYAPGSEVLEYGGEPLVDRIMGDGQGRGGALGEVMESYLSQARRPNDTEAGRESDLYTGEKIGYLWGAVSGGLLDSVQAYKEQFNEDKESRDFAFGLLKKGLGQIAGKLGIPGAVLDQMVDVGQRIYEAGREDERQDRLSKFTEVFNEMSNSLLTYITGFEVDNQNVEGLQVGFLAARTDYLTNYLVNDWINQD